MNSEQTEQMSVWEHDWKAEAFVCLKEIPGLMWYSTILICEVLLNDHRGFGIEKRTPTH